MGILSLTLTDLAWNVLAGQDGPILSALTGDVVLSSIDQFPNHRVELSATEERAVRTIDPAILPCGVIIEQEGLAGTSSEVARGYIVSPQGQIREENHQITLDILPATNGLIWDVTGPGWVAATGIDTIAHRLASHSPPWTASVTDTGAPVPSVSPVHWIGNDPAYTTVDLNSLTKNDGVALGWNVGAGSLEQVARGDCAVGSVAFGSNTTRAFGLTNSLPSYDISAIRHAFMLDTDGTTNPTNGLLKIVENGAEVASVGNYFGGDFLSIAIVAGKVQYAINNRTVYVSTLAPLYPVMAACSIYSPKAAIIGATFTQLVAPKDQYYAVAFENATILDALVQLANRTFRHIRQGVDATLVPNRTLEIGLFGAPPTMQLKTADAESPSQTAARNEYTRLAQVVDYSYDAHDIISIGVPAGGGTGDNQVILENLWRIVNDPDYPGYRLYGDVPGTLFPEYLAAYPIDRRVALNGTYYYPIVNTALVATMKAKGHWSGELWGDLSDPSVSYVDKSPDAQKEAVQRSLYLQGVNRLHLHSEVHFTVSMVTDGRGRITRAGDLIDVSIERVNRNLRHGFMEADIHATPTVMTVTRHFGEEGTTDKYDLSTLARVLDNDSTALVDTMRELQILKSTPVTGSQTFIIGPTEMTANGTHPFDIPFKLPSQMRRMTSFALRVTPKPARHNVRFTTTQDGAHFHLVPIPPLVVNQFSLVAHDHTDPIPAHEHGGFFDPAHDHGAININHGQGTSTPAQKQNTIFDNISVNDQIGVGDNIGVSDGIGVSDNIGVGTDIGIGNRNLEHVHYIPVVSASGQPSSNAVYIVSPNAGDATVLGMAGGSAGQIHTNQTNAAAGGVGANHNHDRTGGVSKGGNAFRSGGIGKNGNAFRNGSVFKGSTVFDNIGVVGGGFVNDYADGGRGMLSAGSFSFNTVNYANPFNKGLADNGGSFIGITTATNTGTSGTDGLHTHALGPDVVETNLGALFQVWLDSGDGVYVDHSGAFGGPWSETVDITPDQRGERFLQSPGRWVGIRVVPLNTSGNPFGIGNYLVSAEIEIERTAVESTIYAS